MRADSYVEATGHELAALSEGICPDCHGRLAVRANIAGAGVCQVDGLWWIRDGMVHNVRPAAFAAGLTP